MRAERHISSCSCADVGIVTQQVSCRSPHFYDTHSISVDSLRSKFQGCCIGHNPGVLPKSILMLHLDQVVSYGVHREVVWVMLRWNGCFLLCTGCLFCLDYRNAQVNHENFFFSPSEAFYNATLRDIILAILYKNICPKLGLEILTLKWNTFLGVLANEYFKKGLEIVS